MTIFRKEHVQPYIDELEKYYGELRTLLDGTPGSANVAEQYASDPDDFVRASVDINLLALETKLKYFKVSVEALSQLKKLKWPPVHRA